MPFDPMADVIDLRDVLAEIEDETSEALEFTCAMLSDLGYTTSDDAMDCLREVADNEPTVIARRYFVQYAQELAQDVDGIDFTDVQWPLYCIDWDYAARELAYDYSTFTYDGRDYLIRSI